MTRISSIKFPKAMKTKKCGGALTKDVEKDMVNLAYKYAWALVNRAKTSVETKKDYAKAWFGNNYSHDQLKTKLKLLAAFFPRNLMLKCTRSPDANDLAACLRSEMGKVKATSSGIYDWPMSLNMMFGDRFFSPIGDDFRYTWGEKVASLVHELTHLVLNTQDLSLSGDREVYGAVLAKEFAAEPNQAPLNSAENWCYYITEFRRDLIEGDLKVTDPKNQTDGLWPLVEDEWDMLTVDRVKWRTKTYPLS